MHNTAGFTITRSALLIDALSTISASGDEDAMLSKLAAALRWLIGFTRLDFATTTDDGHRCRVRMLFGAPSGPGEPWEESLSPTSGPASAFLASGRSWLVSDDTRSTPPRTTLAISLAADERTYGALIFETAEPAGFHAKEIEAARIVGQHLGFALAGSATTLRLQVEVERRTALESELRHAAASAEAANRAKDDFIAMVSHELRSPLNTIVGWVGVLRSGRLPADQMTKLLESLDRNVRLQTRLVDDLIDASRITAGKLHLIPTEFDLRNTVSDVFEAYRGAAEVAGVTLAMEIPPNAVPYLGDAQRLQQVFGNLVSNAIKFTTTPGRRVDICMEKLETLVRISVRDEGRGIDPEFLPHMFEPFRQADSITTRSHGGLGLGLAIARHVVELHRGTLRAESAGAGLGAVMTVELPMP
jgi:signal transduction histidine kinase